MNHHIFDLQMRDFQARHYDNDILRIENQRKEVDTNEIRKTSKKKYRSAISKHSPRFKR